MKKDLVSLRFEIEDNGIGIDKDDLKKIFDPFSRIENARTSGIEGTGLGLSICKSYTEAMGGVIGCSSVLNQGTTFFVELAFDKSTQSLPKRLESSVMKKFTGRRALLVDDNPINRDIAAHMLRAIGLEVESASDGKMAVDRFSSSQPGYYDIVYMDIQMPILNGYEASMAIRRLGHPQAKTIPIVAMTANVFAEDIEEARRASMDGHIGKPLDIDEIISETSRCLVKERKA